MDGKNIDKMPNVFAVFEMLLMHICRWISHNPIFGSSSRIVSIPTFLEEGSGISDTDLPSKVFLRISENSFLLMSSNRRTCNKKKKNSSEEYK